MAKDNKKDISGSDNKQQKSNGVKKNNKNSNVKKKEVKKDLNSIKKIDTKIDTSFVEDKFKKKALEQKTEILDVYEINRVNEVFNENLVVEKDNKKFKTATLVLVVCSLILLLFIIFHFCTVDHNKETIIEKEVIKEVVVVDDNYLFLGDSITDWYDLDKYYKDMPVVNSGVAGYTTSSILDKLDALVYQYNPSKVFLLIGTNDLELEVSNEEIVENIKLIVKNIKSNRPYTKIYLESIYPINNSDHEIISDEVIEGNRKNEDIVEVNKMLVELAKEESVTYIDLHSELVGDDGMLKIEYTIDGLHMSDAAYEKITDILMEYVGE